MDRPSAYNIIIGRVALDKLKAITSTPHLKMKFLTENGVSEVRGDQRDAQQCYNVAMKECPEASTSGAKRQKDEI